ncbi:MAG: AI-2E family transporter [Chloroflexi bacterium]|nr:AI-2E family transporter [Chloroflexota bacterium]
MRETPHDELRAHAPRYLLLVALVAFLFTVRRILVPFVIAGVLAYILSPIVSRMEKRLPLPRLAVVSLFFALTLLPLGAIAVVLAPTFIQETVGLFTRAPDILTSIMVQLFGAERVNILGQEVAASEIAGQILGSLTGFLGQPTEAIHIATVAVELILNAVLSIVLLFYFLADRDRLGEALLLLLPEHWRPDAREMAEQIHVVLGRYLQGVLFLVALMSAVTWVGLTFLFRLPFALPIAIATGFLEVIPLFGPIAAGAIAATVGLEHGGVSLAIWVIAFYYVVRQTEDQLVAPYVLGRAVELHPVVAIFAVLAGGLLAGILGMMLAIPIAATVKVVMDYWQLLD